MRWNARTVRSISFLLGAVRQSLRLPDRTCKNGRVEYAGKVFYLNEQC